MEWQVLAVLLLLCLAPACRAANPHYQFSYGVADASTGDFKTQEETRVGGAVRGSYTLLEPGGTTRTVHYTADDEHGFNAVVQRHQAGAHGQVGVGGGIVSSQHGAVNYVGQAAHQGLALAPYSQGVALPFQQLPYAAHGVLPAAGRGFVAHSAASSYAAPVAASPGLVYAAPSYPSGYATHRAAYAPAAPLAFASAAPALGPAYSSGVHYAPALHGAYSPAPLGYAAPAVKSYAAATAPLGYAAPATLGSYSSIPLAYASAPPAVKSYATAAPAALGSYSSIPLAYASAAPAVKSYATAAPAALGSYSSIPLAYAAAAPPAGVKTYAAPVALGSSIPLAAKTYPPPGPSLGSYASVPLAYAAAPKHVAQVQTVLPTSYSFASFPAHYSASPVLLQDRHPADDSRQLLLSSHR